MQLHVSVMFNMHKKWSGSVVYAATEARVSRLNMFLPRFRLRILAISSCVDSSCSLFLFRTRKIYEKLIAFLIIFIISPYVK